jgi:hypothetical protein
MSRSVLTATVLLASLALAGCSSPAAPAAPFKVTGTVVLSMDVNVPADEPGSTAGKECEGMGLHGDLKKGAQVLIRDGDGKLAGVGELGAGVSDSSGSTCSFALNVAEVTSGHAFYSLELARRDKAYYTAAKLREPLSITL